jgi:hypothetical protein
MENEEMKKSATMELIERYYEVRKLTWPNFKEAMQWMQTEVAEVYELDLARGTWVRNNPDNKEPFSKERLAEELGDAIMMLIVAGRVEGVDPMLALQRKIRDRVVLETVRLEYENIRNNQCGNNPDNCCNSCSG